MKKSAFCGFESFLELTNIHGGLIRLMLHEMNKELRRRRASYPRYIEAGSMTEKEAERSLYVLESLILLLKEVQRRASVQTDLFEEELEVPHVRTIRPDILYYILCSIDEHTVDYENEKMIRILGVPRRVLGTKLSELPGELRTIVDRFLGQGKRLPWRQLSRKEQEAFEQLAQKFRSEDAYM